MAAAAPVHGEFALSTAPLDFRSLVQPDRHIEIVQPG
jgi:hypothetical protein